MLRGLHTDLTKVQELALLRSMDRANFASMPPYKSDLSVKMIKLNDVNHENWNLTDTVQAVYSYLSYDPNGQNLEALEALDKGEL